MSLRPLLVTLLLVSTLPGGGEARAQAQEPPGATAGASREDSLRALRTARSRQAAFERTRRAHLEETWGGGGGSCDERIGRFCLTYSDDETPEWEPEEDPPATLRARERLLLELDSSAAVIPGDPWVAGQRVRYLVEAGRYADASSAAATCRAERWWCEALAGFAAHYAGDAAAAEAAYGRTLQGMPTELRREWTDISVVLDTEPRRRYRRLSEIERAGYEERFWSLADPLAGAPGNDARSEHFSRNVLVRLQERAETTDDLAWGDDLREILIRFGWPSGWERVRSFYPYALGERPSLISHYPDADIDLVPPAALLGDSFAPAGARWGDEERRPRASYPIPRGGERLRWFDPFEHQVALFRDGDSATVVAAWRLPADSLPADAEVRSSLVLWQSFSRPVVHAGAGRARLGGVLMAPVAAAPLLLSLEAVAPGAHRAARTRLGIDLQPLLPGALAASDLLLFDPPGDSLPATRLEVVERVRASTSARPGERLGVYWELYGLTPGLPESMEISLRLVRRETGLLRRLGQRLGVVAEVQPIRLTWAETADAGTMLPRSLALEIPPGLAGGDYAIELAISAPGREPLVVQREIRVQP